MNKKSMKYAMYAALSVIILISVVIFWVKVSAVLIGALQPEQDPRLVETKIITKIQEVQFYSQFKKVLTVSMAILGAGVVVLVSYGVFRKLSVHDMQLSKNARVKVKHRDLSQALPLANGLVIAEQLKQYNAGTEKAFQMYCQMSDVVTRQISALSRKPPLENSTNLVAAHDEINAPVSIPTFRELLDNEMIAPGKKLIFGYQKHSGVPETGELYDLYSTIVIGLSGFGKTTFLAYIISSSALAEGAFFDVLDAHYPSQESLGAALGPLSKTPYVQVLDNTFYLPEVIRSYRNELSQRLSQSNGHFTPRILVVDEHERWSKSSQDLVKLEMDIVNEGRKVQMYIFLSSKSAKADKVGDSALRDNMVTSYVFKTKKHNARTFFKDPDKEQLVKELREPGEAIFTNRLDQSVIIKVPFATRHDMSRVYDLMSDKISASQSVQPSQPIPRYTPKGSNRSENEIATLFDELVQPAPGILTPERCKNFREQVGMSQAFLAEQTNISLSKLKRFELNKATWDPDELNRLQAVIFPGNQGEKNQSLSVENP